MEFAERRRLTQALGWGAGAHILFLLILLIVPMESRQDKVPLGAIKVELGPGTDARAGIKAGGSVATSAPRTPAAQPPTPPPAAPRSSTPAVRQPATTASPAKPSPTPTTAQTPSPRAPTTESPQTAAPTSTSTAIPVETRRPAPPAPVDSGLRSSNSSTAQVPAQEMEGLDLLAGLSDLGGPSQGLSKADGQTKFEAGSGNPVELEDGVVNARPLPLVPPVAPPGTPPGELEVRFVIGSSGLIKITPESLIMKGLSGNIAGTPVTSDEWIRLRAAVEKALRSWIFTTDGREIRGRVVFTIKSR